METTSVRFERPPVRVVELTIFFDQVTPRLTSIATLVSDFQKEFPHVEEEFAREPWEVEETGSESSDWLSELGESFPFPWLTFSDQNGRSVSFQGDRFMTRWEFADGEDYPGYDELKNILERHYSLFEDHIERSDGTRPMVRRTRAEYENKVESDISWSVAQSVFSPNNKASPNPVEGLQGTSSGGLFHFGSDDYVAHVDFAAFSQSDRGSLMLRSTVKSATDDEPNTIDWRNSIDYTHDKLIDCFLKLSNEEQRIDWGMK